MESFVSTDIVTLPHGDTSQGVQLSRGVRNEATCWWQHCRRPRGHPRHSQGLLWQGNQHGAGVSRHWIPRAHGVLVLPHQGPADGGEAWPRPRVQQGGGQPQTEHQESLLHRADKLHLPGGEWGGSEHGEYRGNGRPPAARGPQSQAGWADLQLQPRLLCPVLPAALASQDTALASGQSGTPKIKITRWKHWQEKNRGGNNMSDQLREKWFTPGNVRSEASQGSLPSTATNISYHIDNLNRSQSMLAWCS